MSQQNDLVFMTSNLQESSFDLLNNSNNEELTTQSHGLIKNKDIGVLVYTHGNPNGAAYCRYNENRIN